MKVAPLSDILGYRNPDILARFSEQFSVSMSDASDIFEETLKMLWLMAIRKEEFEAELISSPTRIIVYNPMNVLDEMWHNFVLFTKEYISFCQEYLGGYVHHAPTTASEKEKERKAYEADPEGYDRRFTKEIETQCLYISQKLGVETLTRWFKEFPSRFPMFEITENAQSGQTSATGLFARS